MFETLYGKTFLILGSQLGTTWLTTVVLLSIFRKLYCAQVGWVTGGINADGNLDLDLHWDTVKLYFWALLAADWGVFLALVFYGKSNLLVGIPLFSFWSVLTGIELALCLTAVDENLGSKVLALTALITCLAGLIGAKSGIDFSVLGYGLYFSLLLLIAFGLIEIFFSIPRLIQRLWTLFGIFIFTGYLLYDFRRLSQLNSHAGSNTWSTATRLSISIYLDVINLFLKLLRHAHR